MSYEFLRIIWWLLLGVLLAGFAIMDGFDLGTAILLPFAGRTDMERRIVINTVGPVWEGNQVWFILGGGAIFAAWPPLYAASFSGFYLAMFLVLAALIVRPVGFKFRSKLENPRWRSRWDWALFIGGIVPPLVFGVAFGNLFRRACRSASMPICACSPTISLWLPAESVFAALRPGEPRDDPDAWRGLAELQTRGPVQARVRLPPAVAAATYAALFVRGASGPAACRLSDQRARPGMTRHPIPWARRSMHGGPVGWRILKTRPALAVAGLCPFMAAMMARLVRSCPR